MTDQITQTICITGAASGIGRGAVEHFHQAGWRIIALDKNADGLSDLRHEHCLTLCCDVGCEGEVRESFQEVANWLDGAPLDCLVNNAGIADPACGPLEALSLPEWQRWIDASLTGTFLVSREALSLLRKSGGASIINISSTRALQSESDTFAYSAAKGGVSALTHSMAMSLGPEIRVNAILPGWIATPSSVGSEDFGEGLRPIDHAQHPAGRVGTVADIAQAIAYLAGAGFVTGEQLVVDGGMTRKMIYAE
ncbi:SDR family oxidoreductase [Altererythrobacter indicus]|uniref:SDR family oxidoreductase n=1 Tax=Altericroceibacterium indicum TaxID=374177 RepID=A0A845A9C2_9SPHN|nr:SDR family oxidoreductase [Altericroceibacterium indicum]MXP26850.1 SDR family oxidoreductase [Altericroceibacterium indicum]